MNKKGQEIAAIKEETSEFKGYTLEELRYQRALVALQTEFCKSHMLKKVDEIRKYKFLGGDGRSRGVEKIGGVASKIFSGLNYLDYALIGMQVFNSGKKIYNKIFRRR